MGRADSLQLTTDRERGGENGEVPVGSEVGGTVDFNAEVAEGTENSRRKHSANDSRASGKAGDSGIAVKASVETEDAAYFVLFHGGEVNGVARGEARMAEDDGFGTFGGSLVD